MLCESPLKNTPIVHTEQYRCLRFDGEALRFISEHVAAAERDADAPPVALCSWCGRGQHGTDWVDIEELVRAARLLEQTSLPPLSYGICAPCRADMSADVLVPTDTTA